MNNNFSNPYGHYDEKDPYDPQRIRRTRFFGRVQYLGPETRPRSGTVSVVPEPPKPDILTQGMDLPGMQGPRTIIDKMLGIGDEDFLDEEVLKLIGGGRSNITNIANVVAGSYNPFYDAGDMDDILKRFDFVMSSVNLELERNPQSAKYIQVRQTLRDASSFSFAKKVMLGNLDLEPFSVSDEKENTLKQLHRFRDYYNENRRLFRQGRHARQLAELVEQIPDEIDELF